MNEMNPKMLLWDIDVREALMSNVSEVIDILVVIIVLMYYKIHLQWFLGSSTFFLISLFYAHILQIFFQIYDKAKYLDSKKPEHFDLYK